MVKFSFGAPVSEDHFFNRETELRYLEKRLFAIGEGSRNDLAVIGPRRVGKSSLVLQMASHARKKGFKVIFLDCEGLDLEGFVRRYGNRLIEAELEGRTDLKLKELLRGSSQTVIATLAEVLGRIKALEIAPVLGGLLKLRIEFEKAVRKEQKGETVLDLLEATLSLPSGSKSRYVVIFDEFQETVSYKTEKPFHAILRRIIQFQKNVVYVYTGSSIGMMKQVFGNRKNPLAGNADMLDVRPFSEKTAKEFMAEAFKAYGTTIEDDAMEILWSATNGFPAYLNWAGIRLLDLAKKRIGRGDAEKVVYEMASPISPVYQMVEKQLSRLGPSSRGVLRAIAEGNMAPAKIAAGSGASNIYVYLNRLTGYGLIAKEEGGYMIIDPIIKRMVLQY